MTTRTQRSGSMTGDELRAIRAQLGIPVTEFARLLGLSESAVRNQTVGARRSRPVLRQVQILVRVLQRAGGRELLHAIWLEESRRALDTYYEKSP